MTTELPDGSAFTTVSLALPKTHWLTAKGHEAPPMPFRMGTADPRRPDFNAMVTQAARFAIRGSTMNGTAPADPDALAKNMIVGLLGYHTPDGLCHDKDCPDFDPSPVPPHYPGFEPDSRASDDDAKVAPIRDLVARFAAVLLAKLIASEQKHGYNNAWRRGDWMDGCQADLLHHIDKGDPIDVAAYCAFLWHHGWPTSATPEILTERIMTQKGMLQERDAEIQRLRKALQQYREAMEFTRQYVGHDTLPAITGWSWFDADQAAAAALEDQP